MLTITKVLHVNGSTQRLRLCAAREGLPPLLIVQGGPGLPILSEVNKFQRLLHLEQRFLVGYWEQRGCGDVPRQETDGVSWPQQIADLRTVLTWLHNETRQRVILLGISIGGTLALRAAEQEPDRVKAVIAVSPDAHTGEADAGADALLRNQPRFGRRVAKLPRPPYVNAATFQQRARLLADLGTIERGKTFGALMREGLLALIRTYGLSGAVRAARNMNLVLNRLMPQVVSLDLFANPPRVTVPVHYVFGDLDALTPASFSDRLPAAIDAPTSTVIRLPDAGHMAHFDRPDVIRAIVERV
jgi:pimeloyl-ACP methyl ester carboxylesterase